MSSRGKLSSVASYKGARTALDKFLRIDCKSGRIDVSQAEFFLDYMLSMSPRPPISWFAPLLVGSVRSKQSSLAISLYKKLDLYGVLGRRSNLNVLSILIDCYSRAKLETGAMSALGLILKNGYRPDNFAYSSLIKGLFSEKKAVEAVGLYSKMSRLGCTPNVVIYNVMIDGLCKNGKAMTALQLHREMLRDGIDAGCARICPNVISYSCLIDGLCRLGMEDDAMCLFSEMIDRGIHPNVVTYTILINMLSKKGKMEQAMEILETMKLRGESPNTVTYNTIMDGYCGIGMIDEALNLHKEMSRKGMISNTVTFNSLLKGLFNSKRGEDARSLFKEMKKNDVSSGCSPEQFTYGIMMDGLCKDGHVVEAKELFREMMVGNLSPNDIIYNSLINGMYNYGNEKEAKTLLACMIRDGIIPDVVTFNTIINHLCKEGRIEEARNMVELMNQRGVAPNLVTYSTLIKGLCLEGRMSDARNLFSLMEERGFKCNVVTYSTLIHGYCRAKMVKEAYNLFLEMEAKGCSPDIATFRPLIGAYSCQKEIDRVNQMKLEGFEPCDYTFVGAINACSLLAALEQGRQLHAQVVRLGYESSLPAGNSLITMYSKCGVIQDARLLFLTMPFVNEVSWSAIIAGLGQNGHGQEALDLFEMMLEEQIMPDGITYLNVLAACSNAGLVKEGEAYFNSMQTCYGITPGEDHYACMIDLLCRAGKFSEAKKLLKSMPFEPSGQVWRSFLLGCKIHGNLDLGIEAAEHVLELTPKRGAAYVLLANMYADAGKWDQAGRVRKIMRERGVKVAPGCSWIGVGSNAHMFLVDDFVHPEVQCLKE